MRQFGTNLKQGLQTKLKERKTKCVFFYIIIVTHAPITTSSFTATLKKLFFPHGDIELLNYKLVNVPKVNWRFRSISESYFLKPSVILAV